MIDADDLARALAGQSAPGPKYSWICAGVGALIATGWARPLDKLPTERDLAHSLGVSRSTVVRAYNELRRSGHLDRVVGSGTYVRRKPNSQSKRMVDYIEPGGTEPKGMSLPAEYSIINLSNSVPTPLRELAEAIHGVADDALALSGSTVHHTQGDPALRHWVADWYTMRGLPTDASQVVITTGAQQALTMSCQLLLRRKAYLAVERPTYLGILDIARSRGTHLLSVPELSGEHALAALDEALNRDQTAILYSMSTCHTITGAVLTSERKQEICDAVAASGSFIVDDDILANQTFDPLPSAPIAAYGPDTSVLTIGGTSKLLWDGLRVGWIRAPHQMVSALVRIKSAADLETSALAQLVSLRLLREEDRFARRRVVEAQTKLVATEALLADRFPDWTWTAPQGGRSMWVRLPAGTNAAKFGSAAIEHGVAVASGDTFTADGSFSDYLRLGFVHRDDVLIEGMDRLANAWSHYSATLPG